MPVSKNRKKNPQKRRSARHIQDTNSLVAMRHPFSGLPHEVVAETLRKIGSASKIEFPEKLELVKSLTESIEPLAALSIMATYGLFGSIDKDGVQSHGYKDEEFNQSHMELLQALFLQLPQERDFLPTPKPDTIQELFDALPELSRAYHFRRLDQPHGEKSEEEKSILLIQEELRLHTQVVRNWGYLGRVINLLNRLCRPIDVIFEEAIGAKATDLFAIFHYLIRRSERLYDEHRDRLRPALTSKTTTDIIDAYYAANPNIKDDPDNFKSIIEANSLNLDQVRFLVISHSELFLPDLFTISSETISREIDIDKNSIESALNTLSIKFDELRDNNSEHFFLNNPIWTRPVINLADGEYFCAMPQAFFSFVFPILSDLLKGNAIATKRYEERRAAFLEEDICNLFRKAFHDCEFSTSYKWLEGSDQYENDLMIRVDSHLVLVEAKSTSVSAPALRGAPDRAKRHVKDMLLAPSIQSLRLANRIENVLSGGGTMEALLPAFPISLEGVHTILRLSVTLEDFATLQTTLHRVRDAGWVPSDHPIAPCIMVADLEIVFDVLDSTPHKIHYLKRRADLESNLSYKGDELDLLGFYLKYGFNLGGKELHKTYHLEVTSMSKPIDKYYIAQGEGIATRKPSPKISKWWSDILERLERKAPSKWSDVAVVLLNISFSDQITAQNKLKKLVKNVHKNWKNPSHECAITLSPPEWRSDALVIYAFKEQASESRRDMMENFSARVFDKSHANRCVVIAINVDRMDYPYTSLTAFFRHTPSEERAHIA